MSNVGGGGSLPPIYQPVIVTAGGASQVGNTIRQVSNQVATMNTQTGRTATGMIVSWRTFGDALRQTGSLLKYTLAAPLMNLSRQAVQFSTQFEDSLAKIRGLVGVSAQQTAVFGEEIKKLGPAVGKAPIELADALYFITSAGIQGAKALEVLNASSKAAAAGLGETMTVADAVTSVLNAYGEGTYSSMQATDILTAAVREGKAEASSFAPALGKVLPVAAAFGLSFEDVAASVAALTRSGAEAGTSAIYLRQVLNTLLDPTQKAEVAMEAVGLSAGTIRERIQEGDLLGALESLNLAFDGNVESMAQVFGNVRALTAVFSLLGPNLESNRKIFQELNNTSGDTQKAFDEIAQTTGFKLNQASAQFQASLISIGDAMAPVIQALATFGKIAAKVFGFIAGNRAMATSILMFAGLTTAVAIAVRTFSSFVRLKALLHTVFVAQKLGIKDVYTGLITQVFAQKASTQATIQGTAATTAQTAAIQAFATANASQIAQVTANAAATTAQTSAVTGAAIAQRTLATSFTATSAAAMAAIPILGAILSVAMLAQPIFSKLFGSKKKIEDTPFNVLKQLKEEGIDLGSYTNIGMDITFDPKFSTDEAKTKVDDIREKFADLANKTAKQSESVRFGVALNLAFNLGGDEVTNAAIADLFNIERSKIEEAVKGASVEDVAGAALTSALSNANMGGDRGKLSKEIAAFLKEEARDAGGQASIRMGGLGKFIDKYGEEMSAALSAGNTGVFMENMKNLISISNEFGDSAESNGAKQRFYGEVLRKAFKNADLKGNSDLFKALKDNVGKLPPEFDGLAQALIDAEANGKEFSDVAEEQILILINQTDATKESSDAIREQISLSDRLTGAFKDGVNPELNDSIKLFTATSDAIKKVKDAQDALYSPTFDLINSQTGLRDSLRGVAEAVKESGGELFAGTEKSDAALNSAVKAAQNVLESANATFAATGNLDEASKAAAQGISGIVQALTAGGASPAVIQQFYDQFSNAFSLENIRKTLSGSDPEYLGAEQGNGIAEGILSTLPAGQAAIKSLIDGILKDARLYSEIQSPSQLFAREIGLPIGMGIAQGIRLAKPTTDGSITDVTNGIVDSAKKNLQIQSPSKVFDVQVGQQITKGIAAGIIKAKGNVTKNVKSAIDDALSAAINNAKLVTNVISSRLDFKRSQLDLKKFERQQTLNPTMLARAQRNLGKTERRFGAGGGTEVTSYEASQIEEAQKAVDKLRRDYALGRAPLTDLIDAEENLAELRTSASEKAPEIVEAQNSVDDAQFNVTNSADLLAQKQGEVALKYGEMVTAAAEFNANSAAAKKSFTDLAAGAGLSNTEIGNVYTAVGDVKTALGQITDPVRSKEFKDALDTATKLITGYIVEADKASKLNPFAGLDFGVGGTTNTTPQQKMNSNGAAIYITADGKSQVLTTASGLVAVKPTGKTTVDTPGVSINGNVQLNPSGEVTLLSGQKINMYQLTPEAALSLWQKLNGRASGGPVISGRTYLVGEKGPELFTPSISGAITSNTALNRMTTSGTSNSGGASTNNNFNVNVYNPVPEAASDSISRKLRDLSYAGLFG
jgi:TP901 family phage tail tape measure protein